MRAEKIVLEGRKGPITSFEKYLIEKLTSQLDEAVKEASAIAVREATAGTITLELHQKIVLDRMAYMREKAAGIADTHEIEICGCAGPESTKACIADRIRAMSPASTDAPTVPGEDK